MNGRYIFDEIESQKKRGVLLVLTGPTGAGKDTLFARLIKDDASITKIMTTTSREMRPHEKEGDPYYFISRDVFESMIAKGEFFEWVEFRGHLYGTQQKTIDQALQKGTDVIWHIDAKGIKNIKQKVHDMVSRSVFVFLTAPNVLTLKGRVKKDEGNAVLHRWNEALVTWELEQYDDCDYLVINEDGKFEETVQHIKAIMSSKRFEIQP